MKRTQFIHCIILFFLITITVFSTSHAYTSKENDNSLKLTENEVIDIARSAVISNYTDAGQQIDIYVTEVSYDRYIPEYKNSVYRVILHDPQNERCYYAVYISPSGELVAHVAPNSVMYYANEDELTNARVAVPSKYDIDEKKAIEISRDVITEIGNYQEIINSLEFNAHFVYSDKFNYGLEPVWFIIVTRDGVPVQKVALAYDGTYLDTVPANMKCTNTLRTDEGIGEHFNFIFYNMTLEEKAAFSEKWVPIVENYIEKHPYFPDRNVRMFYYATRQIFGLPNEYSISQGEAEDIGLSAIASIGADKYSLDRREIGVSYDITDQDHPLWVLVIYSIPGEVEEKFSHTYEVKIDAINGAVKKIIVYSGENSFDGYYF